MASLSDFYDFKFDQLAIRYRSVTQDGFFSKLDSESFVNLGVPGAVILLGKNGAGKSRFLNGLKSFGDGQMTVGAVPGPLANPIISLRYSVPTVEEHLEYLEARKNYLNDESFSVVDDSYALQQLKDRELNLHFHDLIIRSIAIRVLKSSFRDDFGFESVQVLQFFEFSEKEIKAFEKRMVDHRFEFGPYNPGQSEIESPRENLNFRDYFAEFFLALLSASTLHQVSYEVGHGSFFDCREFLSDKKEH